MGNREIDAFGLTVLSAQLGSTRNEAHLRSRALPSVAQMGT